MTNTGLIARSNDLAQGMAAGLRARARDGVDGKIVETFPNDFPGRIDALERQLRHLAQSYRKMADKVAKVEDIPHLTKDDLDSIRQAAEARAATVAKNEMDREILPLIDELRTNLKFVRQAEQARSGTSNPHSPAIGQLVAKLVPFVEQLEIGIKELSQHQNDFRGQLTATQDRIAKLDSLQLEMLAASITDQRKAAVKALAGNDQ